MVAHVLPFGRLDAHQHRLAAQVQLVRALHNAEVLAESRLTDMARERQVHAKKVDAVVGSIVRINQGSL